MREFVSVAPAMRVIFGSGTIRQLKKETASLGMTRALVLSTANQATHAKHVRDTLEDHFAGTFAEARMHTPIEVTGQAVARAHELSADGIVSVGGGSTTGLGKAIALRTGLPHLCVPTTYAGSEMTSVLGETADGVKTTMRDPRILPHTVVYDVDLTLGLPVSISIASGMNAMAHAIEALYSRDPDPVVLLMAEEAIRSIAIGLPAIAHDPDSHNARADVLYGAWLCGACLDRSGMALHHKLCHVLGGSFGLPHAETHAIVLPHALAYNERYISDAMARIRRALSHDSPSTALFELNRSLGGKTALRDIGMPEEGIDQALGLVLRDPYWNPRPIEGPALRALLRAAWEGRPPAAAG